MTSSIETSAIAEFLAPDGVALLGRVLRTLPPEALLARERQRWGDRFYFVNPSGGTVGDEPVYATLGDLPEPVQLAVVSVGANRVLDTLDECASMGISNVVIFTGGFAEVGTDGARLEHELAEHVRKLGLTVLGPNTNTNAFEPMPAVPATRTGKIGLVTQSGNQGRPFVQAAPYGVGLSRWVATGNEVDLDVSDFIRYFAADTTTTVVAAYVEGFQDGDKLRDALQLAHEARTPVVMLKMGQTEAGQRMAKSHTGHLTGSDAVVQGLFAQYGVARVADVDELIETANMFAKLPGHIGDGVGVYGASGGMTTLLAETAQRHGLRVPVLTKHTQDRLGAVLPDYLARTNPVDNGMQFLIQANLEDRLEVLRAIAEDPSIDVVVAANNMADGPIAEAFVEDLVAYAALGLPVPVVCVWGTPADNTAQFARLVEAEIPILRSARGAMRSLRSVHDYGRRAERQRSAEPQPDAALLSIIGEHRGVLPQSVALRLLDQVDIATCEERLVTSPEEAAEVAQAMSAPLVMKLASPDFAHRSDYGLVHLDIEGAVAATSTYNALIARAREVQPDATIEGVIVQRQLDGGIELLVGTTQDPVLGPAVTVGFGGVYAEILDDIAVRPVPLTRPDALEMLRSLRGFRILEGVRGAPPADVDAVVGVLQAAAALVTGCDGRLAELDINPLIVSLKGAVAVDVLAVAGNPKENENADD